MICMIGQILMNPANLVNPVSLSSHNSHQPSDFSMQTLLFAIREEQIRSVHRTNRRDMNSFRTNAG